RLDQDILAQIYLNVQDLYRKEGGAFPDPILNVRWPYTIPTSPALAEVAREINGQALADVTDPATSTTINAGQQLPGFSYLRDDGSTLCGNWLYSGSWTESGNQMARRGTEDPSGLGVYPNWAWSWPANRRVLYNRASCDASGKPWDSERRQVWWNESAARWVGNDVHDLPAHRALSLLDEEQPDERAARARAVRRNPGRARRRDGPDRRRAPEGVERARQLRCEGDGHAPDQADARRRQEDVSDRRPDSLGLPRDCRRCRAHEPRFGQSVVADGRRPERVHAGVQGVF